MKAVSPFLVVNGTNGPRATDVRASQYVEIKRGELPSHMTASFQQRVDIAPLVASEAASSLRAYAHHSRYAATKCAYRAIPFYLPAHYDE